MKPLAALQGAIPAFLKTLAMTAVVGAVGCASASSEEPASDSAKVADVNHSKVKRQAIGNCWLYATASWVEALNRSATGKELDLASFS